MQTVSQGITHGEVDIIGRAVVAWGFGRMRPGKILNVGRKNVRLELVRNEDQDTYVKSNPLDEVFLVPENRQAFRVADWLNVMSTVKGDRSRRSTIVFEIACDYARDYQS